jgi:hypothetical protein
MDSTTVTSSILARARAAQLAHEAKCARLQAEREAAERKRRDDEWRPIVDSVLAQIRAQLGDETPSWSEEDEETGVVYWYGDDWMLVQPNCKPAYRRDYESEYEPLKLRVGTDIYTPVMCWSDGRTKVKFAPAQIWVDAEDHPARMQVGGGRETYHGIDQGNDDLLLAIAEAANKQGEYNEKANRVNLLNAERTAAVLDPPKPVAKTDPLETAGKILERFAGGLYCTPGFDYSEGSEIAYEDNRSFLIASQIHALAVEVRELRNTMENRP